MHARLLAAALLVAACDAGSATVIDAPPGTAIDARVTPDAPAQLGIAMIYVGSSDNHIHGFTIDESSLAMTAAGTVATAAGPSFLAFDPAARWLVAVNEGADSIESFAIGPDAGTLVRVDGASSHGGGPAHVSIDRSGTYALVANYGGGTAAVVPISASGAFATATATVSPGANAHEIVTDATNAVAYVPCLGADAIAVYGFDASSGTLTARTPAPAASGAGPRHLALAPDGAHAWVINEKTSTITTYTIGAAGALTAGATVSTRPANASGANTGAEIAVHPSGKWLYASNRGDDTIAVFAIGANGALTLQASVPTGGARPRHFAIVLEGRALLVANQDSATIVGFHLDAQTGALTSVGKLADVPGPQFVDQLRLP
ncbi:MAG: lactonase family protein [Deltaproteobacteria bacterium]|nr:lactonase family protein [Deltaproteobacteria bacterium]